MNEILKLWKSNERKIFVEIRDELREKLNHKYDNKQIDRYLKRLIKSGLLSYLKDESGKSYYIPRDVPDVRDYQILNYFNKVRDYSVEKGWFLERDFGISDATQIGFYGIPEVEGLTDLEQSMLDNITQQLRKVFTFYDMFCSRVAYRLKKGHPPVDWTGYRSHPLFYEYILDKMIELGKYLFLRWDDIGIEELSSAVPDFLNFMEQLHAKYGSQFGRHEVKNDAVNKAIELLGIPKRSTDEHKSRYLFKIEDYNPDMRALLATISPRTLLEYASRPENVIKKWWTYPDGKEIPVKIVQRIIRMESMGLDIFKIQEKEGLKFDQMCFGLEDLSRQFTCDDDPIGISIFKIQLKKDDIERLKKWDWLIERIGKNGIKRFIQIVKKNDEEA
jgi:hypothetical protein